MERPTLPAPMSANDIYMYDMCLSLRLLAAGAAWGAAVPAPPPAVAELKEPDWQPARRKPKTRDDPEGG